MKALKRKPDLSPRRSMTLSDGTMIEVIGITARQSMKIANNKQLTDVDKGIHMIAAKVLINGAPVVADDLLDSFTDEEIVEITEFVTQEGGEKTSKNEQSPMPM